MSGAGEESIYGLIPEAYQPPPKQPLYRSKFPGAWRQWARASARSVEARRGLQGAPWTALMVEEMPR